MTRDYTRRFSKRAGWYARYRPRYPARILAILEREIGFSGRRVVADIGSGTGLLTVTFLENGNRVFGVEPNDEMRSYAERDLGGYPNFVSVKGTAEHTTLPGKSVDLVTAGQALHWFDPDRGAKEFARICRQGGKLCVVYNTRKSDRVGRAYEEIVRRFERDRAKVPDADSNHIARFFKGGEFTKSEVPNEQSLDLEGLLGRLLSASYVFPPDGRLGRSELRRDVSEMFEKFSSGGRLKLRYRTSVFVGSIS